MNDGVYSQALRRMQSLDSHIHLFMPAWSQSQNLWKQIKTKAKLQILQALYNIYRIRVCVAVFLE